MTKAILLITDMPKSCDECPFINGIWCMPIRTEIENPFDEIMKECPLKPLPQKKDMFGGSSYDIIENRGYNICIDEILGEENV